MNRNQTNLTTGRYEVGILLRGLVRRFDTYAGTLNTADLRSLNYAAKRLNERAIRNGTPRAQLNYPGE